MGSNAPCKRCLVIPGPGKYLFIKTFQNEANAPLITKITLNLNLKDLKNISSNSSSNLFNRECTRMVLGVTQRFLRLRKKISDFDVKNFRKNRQRNYVLGNTEFTKFNDSHLQSKISVLKN